MAINTTTQTKRTIKDLTMGEWVAVNSGAFTPSLIKVFANPGSTGQIFLGDPSLATDGSEGDPLNTESDWIPGSDTTYALALSAGLSVRVTEKA